MKMYKWLDSEDMDELRAATYFYAHGHELGLISKKKISKKLIKCLNVGRGSDIYVNAINALKWYNKEEGVVDALLAELPHASLSDRAKIMFSLGGSGDPKVHEHMLRLANDFERERSSPRDSYFIGYATNPIDLLAGSKDPRVKDLCLRAEKDHPLANARKSAAKCLKFYEDHDDPVRQEPVIAKVEQDDGEQGKAEYLKKLEEERKEALVEKEAHISESQRRMEKCKERELRIRELLEATRRCESTSECVPEPGTRLPCPFGIRGLVVNRNAEKQNVEELKELLNEYGENCHKCLQRIMLGSYSSVCSRGVCQMVPDEMLEHRTGESVDGK